MCPYSLTDMELNVLSRNLKQQLPICNITVSDIYISEGFLFCKNIKLKRAKRIHSASFQDYTSYSLISLHIILYLCNMTENTEIKFHDILKADIEKVAMRRIAVKRDFKYLSTHIMDRTGVYISYSTLCRFWGVLADGKYNVQPRRYTLDTLARYVGHSDYEHFVQNASNRSCTDSNFIPGEHLTTSTLKKGALLHIAWTPGHHIVAEHLGGGMFCITESHKSKLSKGDTFQADTMTHGEPLYLNSLIHDGGAPCRYVCGRDYGVRFRTITDNTRQKE